MMSFHIQAAKSPSKVKCAVVFNFEVNIFQSLARNQRVCIKYIRLNESKFITFGLYRQHRTLVIASQNP